MLRDVHLSFGGEPLLDGAELLLAPEERLCLVGRNGSGKSTLLKIAAGAIEVERGERFIQPGCTIRYLPQEPDLSGYRDVLSYVEAGLAPGDDPHRARYLLEQLGLRDSLDPARASGGEARRAALARALAPEPDILLLDEPTNHLDLPAIEWLESELRARRGALLLISHDRRFLEMLSTATLWLELGRTRRLDRGFAAFEEWRDTILEEEQVERHKLDRKIVREQDWVTHGVSGRRKRNQRRLRALEKLRQDRRERRRPAGVAEMTASEGDMSGRLIAELERTEKSYGDRRIVRDLSLRILRGDRLAIVGPNGAGKSTILSILTGKLALDAGSVRLGTNLQTISLDQDRTSLDPARTLSQTLTGGSGDTVSVNGRSKHVAGYMRDFLFQPLQANTPVGRLSGGERGRLLLACALAKPSNLRLLDEPTNDLDLETLDLLQELLADYPGTILLVSHDRDFIDRVATSVLAFEGDGRWQEYPGGYSDMVTQRGHGVTATQQATVATQKTLPVARSAPDAPRRRKLSFKETHALATLPATMARLEKEVAAQQAVLADAGLYARDRAAFDRASAALAQASAALASAEEQWLELEIAREEAGG